MREAAAHAAFLFLRFVQRARGWERRWEHVDRSRTSLPVHAHATARGGCSTAGSRTAAENATEASQRPQLPRD
jgi:hypothetical protein